MPSTANTSRPLSKQKKYYKMRLELLRKKEEDILDDCEEVLQRCGEGNWSLPAMMQLVLCGRILLDLHNRMRPVSLIA